MIWKKDHVNYCDYLYFICENWTNFFDDDDERNVRPECRQRSAKFKYGENAKTRFWKKHYTNSNTINSTWFLIEYLKWLMKYAFVFKPNNALDKYTRLGNIHRQNSRQLNYKHVNYICSWYWSSSIFHDQWKMLHVNSS